MNWYKCGGKDLISMNTEPMTAEMELMKSRLKATWNEGDYEVDPIR